MLDNVFGGFIVIVVSLSLLPIVANQIYGATHNGTGGTHGINVTGSTAAMANLVPFFFSLSILGVGIGMTVGALRQSGAL